MLYGHAKEAVKGCRDHRGNGIEGIEVVEALEAMAGVETTGFTAQATRYLSHQLHAPLAARAIRHPSHWPVAT